MKTKATNISKGEGFKKGELYVSGAGTVVLCTETSADSDIYFQGTAVHSGTSASVEVGFHGDEFHKKNWKPFYGKVELDSTQI